MSRTLKRRSVDSFKYINRFRQVKLSISNNGTASSRLGRQLKPAATPRTDLVEVLGEPGEVVAQVGVQLVRGQLAGGLLGGGGGEALVLAQPRAHREVPQVRGPRVAHQLVLGRGQAVLLAEVLEQGHGAAGPRLRARSRRLARRRLLRRRDVTIRS